MADFGGMGGLGGLNFPNNDFMMGLALLEAGGPKTAAQKQNLGQVMAPFMAMQEKEQNAAAMEKALVARGIEPGLARTVARNPDAGKVLLEGLAEQKSNTAYREGMDALRRGNPFTPTPAPSGGSDKRSDLPATGDPALDASTRGIAGVESAGGNYMAVGPTTRTGDRAYGAYQVMGSNVGPWTEQHYGRRLTPQEFLRNQEAQNAVFKGEFGGYLNQYGNFEDAAAKWFSGKPYAGNNRSDGYMTVPEYVAKAKGLAAQAGLGAPAQVASADPSFAPQGGGQGGDPIAAQYNAQISEAINAGDMKKAQELASMRDQSIRSRSQAKPPTASQPDWRTAQDAPEDFDAKMARIRGGQGSLQEAATAPSGPQASQMPGSSPLPPVRPPGLGADPSALNPDINPNANDGGAKLFAASGMGRGPILAQPRPMALPGVPTNPAPVTSPPPSAPAQPPAGQPQVQVAQGPTASATDAPQSQAAVEQAQNLAARSQALKDPSDFKGQTQKYYAAQNYQHALTLEGAAGNPYMPKGMQEALRSAAKFHFERAAEYLKPTEQSRLVDEALASMPEGPQKEARRQQLLMAGADKRPEAARLADEAGLQGPDRSRVLQQAIPGNAEPGSIKEARVLNPKDVPAGLRELKDLERDKPEEAYSIAVGKAAGDTVGEEIKQYANGYNDAYKMYQQLSTMERMSQNPALYQGKGGDAWLKVQQTARALGKLGGMSDDDMKGLVDNIVDGETFGKFARQYASMQAKNGVGARVTNFELDTFLKSNPGLELTPGANQRLLSLLKQDAERQMNISNLVADYVGQKKQGAQISEVRAIARKYDAEHPLLDPITNKTLSELNAEGPIAPNPAPERRESPKGEGTRIPPGFKPIDFNTAVEKLKANPTKTNRAYFDQVHGKGEAAKVLGGE